MKLGYRSGFLFLLKMVMIVCASLFSYAAGAETFTDKEMPSNHLSGKDPLSAVYGEWIPPDGDAIIRVQACNEGSKDLCAVLVKHAYENLSQLDVLNPDAELQARPLIGVEILNQVQFTKANSWRGGDLYDPRTGKSYFAKVRLLKHDKLKITGCIGPGLCKGYVWKRSVKNAKLKSGALLNPATTSRD